MYYALKKHSPLIDMWDDSLPCPEQYKPITSEILDAYKMFVVDNYFSDPTCANIFNATQQEAMGSVYDSLMDNDNEIDTMSGTHWIACAKEKAINEFKKNMWTKQTRDHRLPFHH